MLRAVLFDWDGTLADTAEASFRCYVRMFTELGIPFDRETYARTYSPNWYHTFRMLDLPQERWAHADARWLAHFAEERIDLIDGARELLRDLRARGMATGIVTSGSRERVMRELELHAIELDACICGSDVKEKKPHPEGLLLCLDRLQMEPHEVVYVGDSPEDVAMARAAGVYAIAVPGGYPNRDALLASRPDAMVESLSGVLGVIPSEVEGSPAEGDASTSLGMTLPGEVAAIWIKRFKRGPMDPVLFAELIEGRGLVGNANQGGKRQITLIDERRWREACEELGVDVDPRARRANVMLRGIDLENSRGKTLRIGPALVRIYNETRPCERKDEAQPGLRGALMPHWRAGAFGEILEGGVIRVGDAAAFL